MSEAVDTAPLVLALVAVLVGGVALVVARELRSALPLTLELLMAAGLLRLAASDSWEAISTVAAVVLVRKLVLFGLRQTPAHLGDAARLPGAS